MAMRTCALRIVGCCGMARSRFILRGWCSTRMGRWHKQEDSAMSQSITHEQIKTFVAAWYRALDNHDPIDTMYDLLTDEGLHVQFPDGDIHDRASFKQWYDRVTNLFF